MLRGMDDTFDARIAAIAASQEGAVSRAQALATGLTDASLHRRVRQGRWVLIHPGVYLINGVPASFLQQVWLAVLAVGAPAAVSHRTAGRFHRMGGVPEGWIELTVAHGRHARVRGAVVHQSRAPAEARHLCFVAPGLQGTTVERTVVDLAAVLTRPRLRFVLDELLSSQRATLVSLGRCLAEAARPGKPGIRKLARLLDDFGPGYVPPASRLEQALFDALWAGGLPAPVRQYPFPGRQRVGGCVDAAYPDVRLILEADGRRWHSRVQDLRRDHDRDADAARAGWQTLRFLHEHIVGDPLGVCATVRDTRAARMATRGASQRELEAIAREDRTLLPPA